MSETREERVARLQEEKLTLEVDKLKLEKQRADHFFRMEIVKVGAAFLAGIAVFATAIIALSNYLK